jgi:hypothetical protein
MAEQITFIPVSSYGRKELQRLYKMSWPMFTKLLKLVPGLELEPRQRVFTPKQVRLIFDHLGTPD